MGKMNKPKVHLICNAHLDPVWQWRWEEGAAEALATFGNAVAILREHKKLIFNHNEAVLYRWVEQYDPALFREIKRLVKEGRWSISGGWYLQPDVNMPGLESMVRQIAEGRRYFWEKFQARPKVAYNFDSFGHSGGLPQILRLAGYQMYIHMRPQSHELSLPSDLYRWRGVDGSEILTLRIAVGLYHTERDNIEERLREGTEMALQLKRDVPVLWGLGNHGGGVTRKDLEKIDAFVAREKRIEIIHSTPDRLYEALKGEGRKAPVVEGELQRVFTGCYTSCSRIKRRAEESLGTLVQTETLRAAAWWMTGQEYPQEDLGEAWRDHLLNDFHDILTGTCTEPAEKDALDLYGKVLETARRLRLGAAAAMKPMSKDTLTVSIPITVLNANPSLTRVPVEVECMADYRPFWKGEWHLRLFRANGREIPCQEEQPESLLPFNDWRRKLCFWAEFPGIGASHYVAKAFPGLARVEDFRQANLGIMGLPDSELKYRIDRNSGFTVSLEAGAGKQCLRGALLEPLVIQDEGDSWGTECWNYRNVVGRFRSESAGFKIIQKGPISTIAESVFGYGKSKIVFQTISYPGWPVLEFRLRIHWNEERKMLKLAVPTVFRQSTLLCEIPGGAIVRPSDDEEHVFSRWALIEGEIKGKKTALAVIGGGQHGLDFADGEFRISILRSAAYCHERGFHLAKSPARKYMDQGVHEVKLLVTAGDAEDVRQSLSALADWLSGPPFALAHLPLGLDVASALQPEESRGRADFKIRTENRRDRKLGVELLSLKPANIRMAACKPSWDGEALVLRLHETSGEKTTAILKFNHPVVSIKLAFRPFEIKTIRLEKSGRFGEVNLISEIS